MCIWSDRRTRQGAAVALRSNGCALQANTMHNKVIFGVVVRGAAVYFYAMLWYDKIYIVEIFGGALS